MKPLILFYLMNTCLFVDSTVIFYSHDFSNQAAIYKKLAVKEIIVIIIKKNKTIIDTLMENFNKMYVKQKINIHYQYAAAVILYIQFYNESRHKTSNELKINLNEKMMMIIYEIVSFYTNNTKKVVFIQETCIFSCLYNNNKIYKYIIAEIVINTSFCNLKHLDRNFVNKLLNKCKFSLKNEDMFFKNTDQMQYYYFTMQDLEIFMKKILSFKNNTRVTFIILCNVNLIFSGDIYDENCLYKCILDLKNLIKNLLKSKKMEYIRQLIIKKAIDIDIECKNSVFKRFVFAHFTTDHQKYDETCSFIQEKKTFLRQIVISFYSNFYLFLEFLLQPQKTEVTHEILEKTFEQNYRDAMCLNDISCNLEKTKLFIYRI